MNTNEITVFPRVTAAGSETEFKVNGAPSGTVLRITSKIYPDVSLERELVSGSADVELPFHGEFYIDFQRGAEAYRISVYAVKSELAGLFPIRGDMHMHTTFSDGKKSPEVMVEAVRKLGLDYMAITDHDHYYSSLKAQKYAEETGLDINVIEGEEVTLPGGGHLLSLGTDTPFHLKELSAEEIGRIIAEEASLISEDQLNDDITPEEYAPLSWVSKTVSSRGGMSVLCHPFWMVEETGYFHLPRNILFQAMRDGITDAIEIPGDNEPCDTMLGLNLYYGCKTDKRMPLIANSDTHDDKHVNGHRWQVVFCKENSKKDIFSAVKSGLSVACEERPGAPLQIRGDFDLAEYAYFLSREYFPAKREFAEMEVAAMTDASEADEMRGASKRYTSDFFSTDFH